MSNKYQVLHIFNDPKFSKEFFEFIIKNGVSLDGHFLFHYRCDRSSYNNYGMKAIFAKSFFSIIANIKMIKPLFQSEKIIIHCLASPFLLTYLAAFPSLAKKTYWVIWGKDLYFYRELKKKNLHHKLYEFFRKKAIKKIKNIITYNDGDFNLSQEWYGCSAKRYKSFMYPSNLYRDISEIQAGPASNSTVILLGNSADPSNNHMEAMSILEKYKNSNIKIITPLSYGDKKYAKKVIRCGSQIFGDKFHPIESLMPLCDYNSLLKTVDIAVFAHKRQQAMGNITTLLGFGVRVYIRDDVTTWALLQEIGVSVSSIYDFTLDLLDDESKLKNINAIKCTFSEEQLLKQLDEILSS